MNKPWSDLPNAHHIDWVLASLKDNHKLWKEAREAAWDAVRESVWNGAWDEAVDAAYYAERVEAWVAAFAAARDATEWAAWGGTIYRTPQRAWGTILSLIAYDYCEEYLAMSFEELLKHDTPQAILLLPMVYVRGKLHDSTKSDSL
jgi:hypothetical protein